jgi:uncharacterized protein (DUF305 family)
MKMARHTPEAEKPASLPVTKLEPTEAEQAEILVLAKRKKARRQAPRFAVHRQEGSQVFQVMPTDVHADAAGARVMNAFGTTSTELAERLVSQIMNTTHLQPSNEPVNANTLNAALAAVTGIAPRDEAEAMLATQMVAVHWVAMDLLRKANDHALLHDAGNLAVKLLRTYTTQLEALKRYRSAGEQRVVVQHQHVNVTAEQAAVQVNGGADPAPGGRGAASKSEEQPHGQQLGHASEPTMRCPEPARDAVPVTGCDGAGPL